MSRSSVAGILDVHGGLRVVVTESWRYRFHVKQGERLFVLPKVRVQEPVPWNDVPMWFARVRAHIDEWIRTRNDPTILDDIAISRYRQRRIDGGDSLHIAGLLK